MTGIALDWVFDSSGDAPIVRVLPVGGGEALIVLDAPGTLYRVDGGSGKVVWERAGMVGDVRRIPSPAAVAALRRGRHQSSRLMGGGGRCRSDSPNRRWINCRIVSGSPAPILAAAEAWG